MYLKQQGSELEVQNQMSLVLLSSSVQTTLQLAMNHRNGVVEQTATVAKNCHDLNAVWLILEQTDSHSYQGSEIQAL